MRSIFLAAAAFAAAQAMAQPVLPPAADPGAAQQRQIEEERRRREAEREKKEILEPIRREALEKPETKSAAEVVRFLVREVEFSSSEILSREELENIAKDFRGRELSLADLQQLSDRVNALYRAKNVVTAVAVIPPQDVSQGVVRVRLVEGRVGRIGLKGNESTQAAFITDRLRLKPTDLVDLDRLEGAMLRFNRTHDVQLRANLMPGTEFATTDLQVEVTEPPRHELRLQLDNAGSPMTGRWRKTAFYLNRSLFGYRDDLYVSDSEATGQSSQAISYGVPVNTWGGRLSLSYNHDKTAIRHGPLRTLNITGRAEGAGLTLRQPTYVGRNAQLDVVAGVRKRYSKNWIDSVFLRRVDVRDHSIGLELQAFDEKNYWLANYVRYYTEATITRSPSMTIDRGTVRYNRDLGGGLSFRGSYTWQSTGERNLPSSELFMIGGEGNVRGYTVGAFSGDNGGTLNLELHHPLGKWSLGGHELAMTGFFFLDHGYVVPFRPPGSVLPAKERLTGAGWGAQATIGKHVYSRLVFAYGPDDEPQSSRRYEVHFQLFASVF
jgi:hemolysin activation/secretion protein